MIEVGERGRTAGGRDRSRRPEGPVTVAEQDPAVTAVAGEKVELAVAVEIVDQGIVAARHHNLRLEAAVAVAELDRDAVVTTDHEILVTVFVEIGERHVTDIWLGPEDLLRLEGSVAVAEQ